MGKLALCIGKTGSMGGGASAPRPGPSAVEDLAAEVDKLDQKVRRALTARGVDPDGGPVVHFLTTDGRLVAGQQIREQRFVKTDGTVVTVTTEGTPPPPQFAPCVDYWRLTPEAKKAIKMELIDLREGIDHVSATERMNREARIADLEGQLQSDSFGRRMTEGA
ncbi:MAG: hypothetical protein ACREMF_11925 [Gemmatimonadales bacterium]